MKTLKQEPNELYKLIEALASIVEEHTKLIERLEERVEDIYERL